MAKKTTRRDALDALDEAQLRMETAADLLERAGRLQDRAAGILDGEDDPALDEDEAPTWRDAEEAIAELAAKGPARGEDPDDAAARIMDLIEDLAADSWPDEAPGPDEDVPEWIPNRVGETLSEWMQRKGDVVVDQIPEIIGAIVRNLKQPPAPAEARPADAGNSDQNPPSGRRPRTIDMKRVN